MTWYDHRHNDENWCRQTLTKESVSTVAIPVRDSSETGYALLLVYQCLTETAWAKKAIIAKCTTYSYEMWLMELYKTCLLHNNTRSQIAGITVKNVASSAVPTLITWFGILWWLPISSLQILLNDQHFQYKEIKMVL